MTPIKIGFIGAGKVGFTLGKYFVQNNINVTGYYSKTLTSAKEAANFTNTKYYSTLESLITESDVVFITTPDDEIYNTWMRIKNFNLRGKIICHTSGSLSSNIFIDIEKSEAYAYSIHPIFPISSKLESYKELEKAYFTIEGHEKYLNSFITMFENFGNHIVSLKNKDKALYHLSAVTASSLVSALISIASSYLEEFGFTEAQAIEALYPLILSNVENVKSKGIVNSLTGPVERCDVTTVEKHLGVIPKEHELIYTALSKELLKIAMKKNPSKDYGKLEDYLKSQEGLN